VPFVAGGDWSGLPGGIPIPLIRHTASAHFSQYTVSIPPRLPTHVAGRRHVPSPHHNILPDECPAPFSSRRIVARLTSLRSAVVL